MLVQSRSTRFESVACLVEWVRYLTGAALVQVMDRAAAGYNKPCYRFELNKTLCDLATDPLLCFRDTGCAVKTVAVGLKGVLIMQVAT